MQRIVWFLLWTIYWKHRNKNNQKYELNKRELQQQQRQQKENKFNNTGEKKSENNDKK